MTYFSFDLSNDLIDINEELHQNFPTYGNLFTLENFTEKKIILNGEITTNGTSDAYGYSDYIPVIKGKTYYVSHCLSAPGALYDKNKNYIKNIYTKPSNIKYGNPITFVCEASGFVRLNVELKHLNYYVFCEGTEPTNILPRRKIYHPDLLIDSSQISDYEFEIEHGNLFNSNTVSELGYYINKSGNIQELENYVYSDYIPVKANTQYIIYLCLTSPGAIYNTEKQYIGQIPNDTATHDFVFSAPINGYIRINIHKNNIHIFTVYEKNYQNNIPYGMLLIKNLMIETSQISDFNYTVSNSVWKNKTISIFGDSRTWYHSKSYNDKTKTEWKDKVCVGFQYYMENILHCNIDSQGVSGDTSVQICERIKAYDFSNTDAILIEGGVNDFIKSSSVTIGQIQPISSNFDTNTVYGAYQSAIEYLLQNYPTLLIYMDIPAIAWSSAGVFPYDIAKIKSEIAQLYNLPYIDLYKKLGINELNRDYYYCDDVEQTNWRLHFNDYGNELIGTKIAQFINTY